ncbi:MAG: hypothetical protein HF982_08735 [Desulfobacteraceae bacterium]|nr:hypothetical protein [Desulfobacteraceae bacterium]MBC2719655.1 hypothetical protein [Desulfobacteraceae bacterium]
MTDANNNIEMPSLLPYLEITDTKFQLNFSLISQDISILEKSSFPFLIISESDPFARLIEARFVTDAGSEIKRAFLLLQKNEYHLTRDELRPFNNQDVDQCWQKAFLFSSKKNQDGSAIILADQIGENGGLIPFQPLFFCKSKQIFFHPPCPICGLPLQQCYDDDILTGLGFQPYSASLKRYLFCSSCFGSTGESNFYVFSLESSDHSLLKDRWELIKDFGRVTEVKNHLNQFPCIDCSSHQECYGSDCLAVLKIVPISFYPFHMLIFEAGSINIHDFLSLISGASFDDLESRLSEKQELGRINCLKALKQNSLATTPFFFDKNKRYFLEVLYLKLSFLGELVQTIFSRMDDPGFGLSIDRIWINLADQSGLLPLFWNFKLNFIDIGGNAVEPPFFPKLFPYSSPHFLGIIWFYTLLVNKKQGVSEVYVSLGEKIEKIVSNDDNLESFLKNSSDGAFSPENIFWIPDVKSISQDWVGLWEKSIGLGWSLLKIELRTGLIENSKWSKDKFQQELENLRKEVKHKLFSQQLNFVQAEPASENKVISDILAKITEKWSIGLDAQKDELEKTVGVSTASRERFDNTNVVSQDENGIEETVILLPDDFRKEKLPSVQAEENDIPVTVVITPSEKSTLSSIKKDAGKPKENDFISETVILYPENSNDKR